MIVKVNPKQMIAIFKDIKRFADSNITDEHVKNILMTVTKTHSYFTVLSDGVLPRMRIDFSPEEVLLGGTIEISYASFLEVIMYFKDSPEPLLIELDYDLLHFDDGISPPETIMVGQFDASKLEKKEKWEQDVLETVFLSPSEFFTASQIASGFVKKTFFSGLFDTSKVGMIFSKDNLVLRGTSLHNAYESKIMISTSNEFKDFDKLDNLLKLTFDKKVFSKLVKVLGAKSVSGNHLEIILPSKHVRFFYIKKGDLLIETPFTLMDEPESYQSFLANYQISEPLKKKEVLLQFGKEEALEFVNQLKNAEDTISFNESGLSGSGSDSILFNKKLLMVTLDKLVTKDADETMELILHVSTESDGVLFVQNVTKTKKDLIIISSVEL